MPLTVEQLREEDNSLPEQERLDLADYLYGSVSTANAASLSPEWMQEIERRSKDMSSGKIQGIPAEQVSREMEELLNRE